MASTGTLGKLDPIYVYGHGRQNRAHSVVQGGGFGECNRCCYPKEESGQGWLEACFRLVWCISATQNTKESGRERVFWEKQGIFSPFVGNTNLPVQAALSMHSAT